MNKKILWLKPVLLSIIILTLFIISHIFKLGDKLMSLKAWIQSTGFLGAVIYSSIYIVATVLLVPGSALTIIAGSIFGSFIGVILVSVSSTIGASLAFLVARYVARDSISEWLSHKKTFHKLDNMSKQYGSLLVAITRLIPLFPFNLLNYAFGLTKVKFLTYVFWSWVCMLPGTILYVVGSDVVTQFIANGKIPIPLIIIVIVFAVLIGFLVKYMRKQMKMKE